MTISYGDWHTLTVSEDGEDGTEKPLLDMDLEHTPDCTPLGPDGEPVGGWFYRCAVDMWLYEFGDWPTRPGRYRVRAWSTPRGWAGSEPVDADGGVEYDEEPAEEKARECA